jgi:hypothetical protein
VQAKDSRDSFFVMGGGWGFVGLRFGQSEADWREEREGREEGKVHYYF